MQLPELFERASQAAFWATLAKWFDLIGGALTFLFMVRILGPEDFGIYGLALLVLLLPETLVGGALGESLIQKADLRPGHVAATALLQLIIAPFLAIGLAVSAPWVAQELGHHELRTLLPPLAASLIPLALGATPACLLQRELRFRAIAMVDAAGTLTAAAVGLTLAVTGHGVWSLAWMEVARRAVRAAGFVLAHGWPLSSRPTTADFAELAHFNVATLAMRIVIQIDGAIPRFFLGLVSATALGYFNLAHRVFTQFNTVFIAPFNGIALPVASRIQGEPEKLHAALDGAGRIATLVAYPILLGAAAIAPIAIPTLLGQAWAPATVAVQLMLILGMRSATASVNGGVLRAVGRPGLQLGVVSIGVVIIACLTPFAVRWGADAVAAVYLLRGLVTWAIGAALIERIIGYPATRQFSIGWENFVCAGIMAAVVILARTVLGAVLSGPALLVTLIMLGAVAFVLALGVLSPATIRLFKRIVTALYKRDRHQAAALAYEWARSARQLPRIGAL